MVEFINNLTDTRMLVAEDRASEYLAAGHRRVDVRENVAKKTQSGSPAVPTAKRKAAARK